jgi:glycosyltransferase involved in cell wall biosynthesis
VRALLVNHTSLESGGELSLLGLLEELERDVERVLACPEGDLAESARSRGVPVVPIPGIEGSFRFSPTLLGRAARELTAAASAVARVAEAVGPDLVHAYSVRAGLAAALVPRWRLPLIVHVHDVLPDGLAATAIARLIGARAELTLTNSEHTARRLRERGFRGPLWTVHEGIDLRRFDPAAVDRGQARARLGLGPDAIALGLVGQITPWKGQDVAIEALARLRSAHPRTRLLVVGETKFVSRATRFDNATYLAALHQLVADLHLQDAVHFLGQRADVPTVFRALDVALVPSCEEPFGRAVIEAMSMGTPVVATDRGGPREVITHGVDGLLVPPRDPQRLADAVSELLDDNTARAEMGTRARRTACRFSRSVHADLVAAAYRDVLGGVAGRPRRPRGGWTMH